jgi:hypothetical protein
MSNVITFLERMGRDAQLRHASQGEVELALARTRISPELQAAILAHDKQALEELLGGNNIVCCLIQPELGNEGEFHLEQCA